MAFEHNGFWQPMDTLRDKMLLEKLWNDNVAPWKVCRYLLMSEIKYFIYSHKY